MRSNQWSETCQAYIDMLYNDVKANTQHSITRILDGMRANVSLTYGEILYQGLEKLFACCPRPLTRSDVFVDCGSGLGKLLIQVLLSTPVRKVIGVEIESNFAAISQCIADRVLRECHGILDGRQLEVIEASFFDVHLEDATVMFSCSICFTEAMIHAMGEWMSNHSSVHTILSLKPIASLKGFRFLGVVEIECTWDSALVYLYAR